MSREKQIEEMAKVIERACENECISPVNCDVCKATSLYNAGYRKQVEGEWKEQGECWKTLRCSICGHTTDTIFDRTPFCPNCGAKMKGETQ